MKKQKRNRKPKRTQKPQSKMVRLGADAAKRVEDWSQLTGKSQSWLASLFILNGDALLTNPERAGEVKAHLSGLVEVERVKKLNDTRLREAEKKVPAL